MFKIAEDKHSLAYEESVRGREANARGKLIGALIGVLSGAIRAKGEGDNTWTIDGAPFRTHSLVNGKKDFSLNPASEPGHIIVVRSLKEDDGEQNMPARIFEGGVYGFTRDECIKDGREIETKGRKVTTPGRVSVKVTGVANLRLGTVYLPLSMINVQSPADRDRMMRVIDALTADEMVKMMGPITRGNIREFVTDGREKAEDSLPADWQDSQPKTDDERTDSDGTDDPEIQSASEVQELENN